MKHILLPALCALLTTLTTAANLTIKLQIELPANSVKHTAGLGTSQETLTRVVEADNEQLTARILAYLSALAEKNTTTTTPATDEHLRHLVHGLLTMQTQLHEMQQQPPATLQAGVADLAKTIDDLLEQSCSTTTAAESGVAVRGIDMAEVQRAKLNRIIEQLEQLITAVGTPNTMRSLNFETLEHEEQLSMIDLLRAMYHKLHAITG